jgi:hypothetical protein
VLTVVAVLGLSALAYGQTRSGEYERLKRAYLGM